MSTVQINNIKAIRHLSFDLPEDGAGVIVLCGENGAGKTTAITAVQALLGVSDDRLSPTRGCDSGEVVGLGRSLRVGKRQTTTGSPDVGVLRGIDLSTIVDPDVSDKQARTKYRIRQLVSLGGRNVDPAELVNDCHDYVDIESAKEIEDPVRLADFVKRGLENAARDKERSAEVKAELSKSKFLEAGDIDELSNPVDSKSLADAHRLAMQLHADAVKQQQDYDAAVIRNAELNQKIIQMEMEFDGPAIDIDVELTTVHGDIEDLDKQIAELKERLAAKHARRVELEQLKRSAKSHNDSIAALENQIVELGDRPLDSTIESLRLEEQSAYEAVVNCNDIQRRKACLEESRKLNKQSVELSGQAEFIRNRIEWLKEKIQEFLPAGPLSIVDGDLVHTELKVPFDELSEGQRWYVALTYAIGAVGAGGVIPISQEAWQSFAQPLKRQVLDHAKESGVVVLTAQVSDGSLRAEEYLG